MQPIRFTKVVATPSATAIAASQTPTGAGNLTLTATPVVLTTGRQVLFTCGGSDAGRTFTLYGTNEDGGLIQENVAGSNGSTTTSVLSYKTVTQISVDAAMAGTITVGTNANGSSKWYMPNFHLTPFALNITTELSGSVTYQLESTLDDYWTPVTPTAQPHVSTLLASGSSAAVTAVTNPVVGWRVTITAGTGTLSVQADQAGITNY
jgi:hypothetical protein